MPYPVAAVRGHITQASIVGWWLSGGATNCVVAYQPKGAASLAASYTNLHTPGTNDAQVGVAPTWDATNGWIFDGNTQYLTAVSVNGGNYTVIVRFTTTAPQSTGQRRVIGVALTYNSDPHLYIAYNLYAAPNDVVRFINGNGTYDKISPHGTGATLCIAGNKVYFNGVDEGITLTAWSGSAPNALGIGAQKTDAGSAWQFLCKVQAIAIYSSQQSAATVAALTTAMNAL